ncbi:MAG: VOC family protein [Arthrobacter sp.]|uniref:VOC family protein n=1 Tax=Arthrobacter TaxID=1663 RepID=UPI0026539E1C|nr:VOC family protein [Micrococcaceae bacterium]MDN5878191.1 VOC family protein [Micrococcaceae bacterium]MDN6178073.1 VOC family protein [Micrococcaceae bacterium]MDN6298671.1 VOC family protein [Micrococcaceae bacterium]
MPMPVPSPGAPCWIDLMSSQPERARGFYAAVFGWTFDTADPAQSGRYFTAFKDGLPVAGIVGNDGEAGLPDTWSTYLRVEDIEATLAVAVSQGGKIMAQTTEIVPRGRVARALDPSGASVGLWEIAEHRGFRLHGEPGAPYWHELHARNYVKTVQFYQQVFSWQTTVVSYTDDFRYTTLGQGPEASAGIIDAAPYLRTGHPSAWQVYFQVVDTEATITRALGLGASVIEPPVDTTFGRVAALSDPTGALFKIAQPSP